MELFEWINIQLSHSYLDLILPFLREKTTWIPFYIFIIAWSLWTFSIQKGMLYILVILTLVGITDFTSSKLIKETVERPRPCQVAEIQQESHLLVPCGAGYSFPSSHAANHFALAMFLMLSLRRRYSWILWPLILWASLISFAQIYVGVHYPLDSIGGAILGSSLALLVWFVYKKMILTKNPLY